MPPTPDPSVGSVWVVVVPVGVVGALRAAITSVTLVSGGTSCPSAGSLSITVPALRGLPLADARAALNRTGLHYRVLYLNSTAAPGTVIDSDPAEGQEVPPDTRVTIVVAQQGGATTTTGAATATATG